MNKVYLVLEEFYCDITVLWAYVDPELAEAQAEWLNDMNYTLGRSGCYYVEELDVA